MQDFSESKVMDKRQSARLLIVDDNAYLRASLRQQFVVEGFYNIFDAGSSTSLETALKQSNPDLILLDIHMLNNNGVNICKRLRSQGFTNPILMLTSKNVEPDIIAGLEAGANDYITKPLRMTELLERIKALLKQLEASNETQFEFANLCFLPANKILYRNDSTLKVILTEKETAILKFLYRSFPDSVTKEEILFEVWGFQDGLTTHTLETHIYRLRQKINCLTKASLVVTTENGYGLAL